MGKHPQVRRANEGRLEFKVQMVRMLLVLQENRVVQVKEALQEFQESVGSHIIQAHLELKEIQEHQSQDPQEPEPPDL